MDNASRVIKYVAILGYRLDSYNLVDMRIHDINVVADLNEHHPTNPSLPPPTQDPPAGIDPVVMEDDGTQLTTSQTAERELSTFQNDASNFLSCYWTGWWPTLHFEVNFNPYPTATISIKIWIDILGMWGVDGFSFQLVNEESMSDTEINALAVGASEDYAPYWMDIRALTIGLSASYWAARTLAPLAEKGNIVAQGCFAIAVAAFLILWHMWIIEFLHMVILSQIDAVAAGYMLVALAVSVLLAVGSHYASCGRLPSAIYSVFGITDVVPQPWSLASYAIFAMSLMLIIQIVALAACLIYTTFIQDMANDIGYIVET